jgi:hypothetical protein
MPRFLVEVSHDSDAKACIRVVEAFLRSGSHFLTRADWGCKDGDHKAWMIVDVDSKDDARSIVPSEFRLRTRVVGLHAFTVDEVAEVIRHHGT